MTSTEWPCRSSRRASMCYISAMAVLPSSEKSLYIIVYNDDEVQGFCASGWHHLLPQHSLPGGRYPLPEPDFHRLDRASFAWRTRTDSEYRTGIRLRISPNSVGRKPALISHHHDPYFGPGHPDDTPSSAQRRCDGIVAPAGELWSDSWRFSRRELEGRVGCSGIARTFPFSLGSLPRPLDLSLPQR